MTDLNLSRSVGTFPVPVVWDGLGLGSPHSGVGFYGRKLFTALQQYQLQPFVTSTSDTRIEFVPKEQWIPVPYAGWAGEFLKKPTSFKLTESKPIYPIISYSAATKRHQKIIYHGLSNLNLPCYLPKRAQDRFVLTVHDIIPIITKKMSSLSLQMRVLLPRAVKIADAIIVPSKWTRDGLVQLYGESAERKIIIIPNGTDSTGRASSKTMGEQLKNTNDILIVARGESYKRLHFAVNVANRLPNRSFTMVTDKRGAESLTDVPRNLKILVGVGAQELDDLYVTSRIFMHPALYEGWCLPAADALINGLPVVFTSGSGIDEVCSYAKDQTTAMRPEDDDSAWAEAVKAALEKYDRQPGSAQTVVKLPTWGDCAEKTLKIYQSLL